MEPSPTVTAVALADAVVVFDALVGEGALAGGAGSGGVRLHPPAIADVAARAETTTERGTSRTARGRRAVRREVIPDSSHERMIVADKIKRHRVRARGGGSLNAVPLG